MTKDERQHRVNSWRALKGSRGEMPAEEAFYIGYEQGRSEALADARDEALEEAAKVCDRILVGPGLLPHFDLATVAEQIRALKKGASK